MHYIEQHYTQRVKCFDGVVRTTETSAFFVSRKHFLHYLEKWNGSNGPCGEPYEYFESPEQNKRNFSERWLPSAELYRYPTTQRFGPISGDSGYGSQERRG